MTGPLDGRLPGPVRQAMARLEQAGYRAYVVGGALRDLLLGRQPQDYDLASTAPPQQVSTLFAQCRVVETGLRYGTVTVHTGGMALEITALRRDGRYRDGRRPVEVQAAATIEEDLARRDFTINAMAYGEGKLIDPFGGQQDLARRQIRTVGRPEERFQEDALRILRALRFAAVLGFSIEAETAATLREQKGLLSQISQERITEEFTKWACGPQGPGVLRDFPELAAQVVPELEPLFGFDQHTPYHIYDVWEHTLHVLDQVPPDPITKLAALFHDIGKPACFFMGRRGTGHFKGHGVVSGAMTAQIMRHMRYSNQVREAVCELVRWHDENIPQQDEAVRLWLNRLGPRQMGRLLDLQQADSLSKSPWTDTRFAQELRGRMERILQRGDCFTREQLAVNGQDLKGLGAAGPRIGQLLDELLRQVMRQPEQNQREILLDLARRRLEQSGSGPIKKL